MSSIVLKDCPRCQAHFTDFRSSCTKCGMPFRADSEQRLEAQRKASISYFSAFQYPLRGSGLGMIIVGTLCFSFLGFLPVGGLFQLFAFGYIAAYMFKIVTETSRGNLEPADWPEFNNLFDDIVKPFFNLVGTYFFCALPALIVGWNSFGMLSLALNSDPISLGGIAGALFLILSMCVLGLLYLPMALLSVAMMDSLLGLYPPVVIKLIMNLPKDYATVLIVILCSFALNVALGFMLSGMGVIGALIQSMVGLYITMVNMHAIGLIYYLNRGRL